MRELPLKVRPLASTILHYTLLRFRLITHDTGRVSHSAMVQGLHRSSDAIRVMAEEEH